MSKQSGFTAIELLITLFVAAAFLIAGYQLFNVVIKDGGQARAESRAANVAYDYMRRYTALTTNPCVEQTLLDDSLINVDGLANAKITVEVKCLDYSSALGVSKIEVSMRFNSPEQSVKYSTFVNGSANQVADVTEGLIAWWKFNGDANSAVGTMNGTVTNATPVQGQNSVENGAYSFNGTNAKIEFPLTGLPSPMSEITLSMWIKPTTVGSHSLVNAATDDTANRFNVHLPYVTNSIYWDFGNISTGRVWANSVFDNGWLNTWSLFTFTSSPTGGMKVYRNGVQLLTSATSSSFTKGTKVLNVAYYAPNNWYWPGSIDDMRIYGRALSASEILTLYNGGAK